MRILVMSDSHSTMRYMRLAMDSVKPDAVIHLGDHYDNAETLAEEYVHIRFHMLPGNCDRYRCPPWQPAILIERVCGVKLYMTHGHKHNVKSYLGALLQDARASAVDAVLYGHTHIADCRCEEDGLWVLNPGSCGCYGGSAGIIEIECGRIKACRLITDEDLL